MNQLRGYSMTKGSLSADRDGEFAASSAAARAVPVAGTEQAFFRLDLKRALQLHWRLARTVALWFAALAVVYLLVEVFWFQSWPAYRSLSVVYVQPTPGKILPIAGSEPRWPSDSNTYETYIHQQMMNVSRQDVLIAAVHKVDGFERPGENDQEAARRLVRRLEVIRAPDAYQFSISARDVDPEKAAALANAATAAYIESASRDERAGDLQRLSMLKEEKDRIESALTADHAEQDDLNKQLGVAGVGATVPDHYDEDITQIRAELVKARTEHDEAVQKSAALGAGNGHSSAAIDAQADGMIANDAGLVSMKQSLNARRALLISQMANLTPLNPQFKQDEAELVKINGDLDAKMKDLRGKAAAQIQLQLHADIERTSGLESQLNGQLRRLVGAATSATPKMQRSGDLAADITRLRLRYAAVDEQWHNLMLEDNAPAAAHQIAPAVAPIGRSKSGVLRNALLIVIAGLIFGVLTAIAAHKLDPRVYIAADVEHVLGYPPLALLPDFSEVTEGVAEEYTLRLASAIEHGRKQGNLKNCIFTGTASGTGVSTLVNKVRGMLEAMGRPTVLVDATGAHAPTSRDDSAGRNELLESEGTQSLVKMHRVSRPTALLQQMADRTETEEETLVLTDTAPLLVSAETEYLARFVDCAIVVIQSGVTTRAQLRETATMLQRLSVGSVGFVLNRVGMAKADPAFRAALEAVEKHLEAQAAQATRNPEKQRAVTPEFATEREELPNPPASHSNFEPEIAAAAAAVARFSPPRRVEPTPAPTPASSSAPAPPDAICSASPTMPTPVAEGAKRFFLPLVAPKPADPPTAPEPPVVVRPNGIPPRFIASHVNDDVRAAVASVPSTSPFAEAAKRFSSSLPTGPGAPFAPHPISVAPISNALPVGPEKPPASRAQAEVKAGVSTPAAAPQRPATSAGSAVPWWLSEAARNSDPSRPPVLWNAAKDATTTDQPGGPEAEEVEAKSDSYAAQDSTAAAMQDSVANEPPRASTAPVTEEAANTNPEDAAATRTSRLSGLRNLLFVLGVKNGQHAEDSGEHAGHGWDGDLRTKPQTFERAAAEAREYTERNIGGASPRMVTAPPEFLPPKPIVIDFDKADARVSESSTRQDRRVSADGVEILPSKRGQYKKL
jgi:polysaccharide biosynthesis transport protein